jgi:hypothetical protein
VSEIEWAELPSGSRDPRLTSAEPTMIWSTLSLAAAAVLIPAAAHAQAPCSLLTPDQIKPVLSVPVNPGQPGAL